MNLVFRRRSPCPPSVLGRQPPGLWEKSHVLKGGPSPCWEGAPCDTLETAHSGGAPTSALGKEPPALFWLPLSQKYSYTPVLGRVSSYLFWEPCGSEGSQKPHTVEQAPCATLKTPHSCGEAPPTSIMDGAPILWRKPPNPEEWPVPSPSHPLGRRHLRCFGNFQSQRGDLHNPTLEKEPPMLH